MSEEEAVCQALLLWEEHERRRVEVFGAVERARASLARGEGRRIASDNELLQFAEDVKRRGIERLAAGKTVCERNPPLAGSGGGN